MQSLNLRRVYTYVCTVLCMCLYLSTYAFSDYGPAPDPIIEKYESNVSLSVTCPMPISGSCSIDIIYQDTTEFFAAGGEVNIPDECSIISFGLVSTDTTSLTSCSISMMRRYEIETDCDEVFSCLQLVVLSDTEPPVITDCPMNVDINASGPGCTATYTPPTPIAVDDCGGDLTYTNDAPAVFPEGTTTITYTVTDNCGNTASCMSTVTVIDNTPPTITCPPALATQCAASDVNPYTSISAFLAAGGTITDNCTTDTTNFTITTQNDSSDGGSCPETVTRTYVVTDLSGNSATCTQSILVEDTVPPTITAPADMTVSCSDTSPANSGEPTTADNCTAPTVTTFTDVVTGSNGMLTITRTWTVTDLCGNAASDIQIITTDDTERPVAVCRDFTVYLDVAGMATLVPDSLDGGSTDNCSDLTFTASSVDFICNDASAMTQNIDLYVQDASGLRDTCTSVVTVLDTFPAELIAPPTDTVACDANVPMAFATIGDFMVGGGTLLDSCGGGSLNFVGETLSTSTCPQTITRTYTYTDHVGLVSDPVDHIIIVDDNVPPSLTCPSDFIITETDICDTLLNIMVVANDNCGQVTITNDYNMGGAVVEDRFGGGVTEITFIATDPCGNADTCTVTVSVAADPKITLPLTLPSSGNYPSYDTYSDFVAAGGSINENCNLDTTTFSYSVELVIVENDSCFADIVETFSIQTFDMENCIETRSTRIEDTTPPVLNCMGINMVLGMQDATTCEVEFMITPPTVTDDFVVSSLVLAPIDSMAESSTTYWIATDACGNSDSCSVQVSIFDGTSPIFLIDTADVMCIEMAPQYSTLEEFLNSGWNPVVEDCNLDSSSFAFVEDVVVMGTPGKKYTISDDRGNVSTEIQFFDVMDVTAPVIVECTADTVVSADVGVCQAMIIIDSLVVMDNCDSTAYTITNDFNNTADASDTYPLGTTTVTWTVDDGENTPTTCSFTVTVTDNENPTINCPSDTTLLCTIDGYPASSTVVNFTEEGGSFSDNCEIDSTLWSPTTILTSSDQCTKVYEREYVIFDKSGNSDTCTQLITVTDTVAPILSVPGPDTLALYATADTCGLMSIMLPTPLTEDNCGIDTLIVVKNNEGLYGSLYPVGITNLYYTLLDSCGNAAFDTLVVNVEDTIAPTLLKAIDTIRVSCTPTEVDTLKFPNDINQCGGDIVDACGFEVVLDSIVGVDTITSYYSAVDPSGNILPFTKVVARTDYNGPVITSLIQIVDDIEACDDLPPHQVVTFSDPAGVLSVVMDTLPFSDDVCIQRQVTYQWIATDSCGNVNTEEASFMIFPDDEAPEAINAPDTVYTFSSEGMCKRRLEDLVPPTFSDGCSGLDTVFTTNLFDLKFGENFVDWVAIDNCGNADTLEQFYIVQDTVAPAILCDKLVSVNLTDEASNYVNATSFIEEIVENCTVDSVLARRTSMVCGDPSSIVFDTLVRFCCEEIGDTVDVEVRVVDRSGNISTCTATAIISDKLVPSITYSLPDITISCGYNYDTLDMAEFGELVFDAADRDSIIVEDQFYDATNGFAGLDGVVYENCNASISESVIVDIDECNVGTLTRILTVTDDSGNSATTDQVITVIDFDPFYINRNDPSDPNDDIIWPETFTWEQCLSPAPDTSIAGAPVVLNEDECSQVSVTFVDLPFEIGNGGCAYIRRKWSVIDWCQYDSDLDPNPGRWDYDQDIYVKNTTAPTISTAPLDTVICAPGSACVGVVNLSIAATDDCTDPDELHYSYRIDEDSNGSWDVNGTGSSFGRMFTLGTHRVEWTVEDRCNNDVRRIDTFTVRDCKLPTAICLDGLSISLGSQGTVDLWASDIDNKSSDNCTSQADLKLSFSSDPDDFGRTFTCDDVGDNELTLYVTDEAGNQSFCTATVNIQDNAGMCNGLTTTTVMGNLFTAQGTPMANTKVMAYGAELTTYDITDTEGGYAFTSIEAETDVEIVVESDDNYLAGVNTLDIIKIQRHILGIESLETGYQVIAADANGDERLSAADLLAIRKLILGITDELPNVQSWSFVTNETFVDAMYPWPLQEEHSVDYGNYVTEGDFVGVKIADVDNTIDNLFDPDRIETRSKDYLGLVSQDKIFTKGEVVTVHLMPTQGIDLAGIQFTLSYDNEKLKLIDIIGEAINLNDDNHHSIPETGALTLSWSEGKEQAVGKGAQLMTVTFEAIGSGTLSTTVDITSDITSAHAYDNIGEEYELYLDYLDAPKYDIAIYQNRPNPFFDETIVDFEVPEEMEIGFTLFDMSGKIHWSQDEVYKAGKHQLRINSELNDRKGVFYLKMDAAEFTQVIKMIKIK